MCATSAHPLCNDTSRLMSMHEQRLSGAGRPSEPKAERGVGAAARHAQPPFWHPAHGAALRLHPAALGRFPGMDGRGDGEIELCLHRQHSHGLLKSNRICGAVAGFPAPSPAPNDAVESTSNTSSGAVAMAAQRCSQTRLLEGPGLPAGHRQQPTESL